MGGYILSRKDEQWETTFSNNGDSSRTTDVQAAIADEKTRVDKPIMTLTQPEKEHLILGLFTTVPLSKLLAMINF